MAVAMLVDSIPLPRGVARSAGVVVSTLRAPHCLPANMKILSHLPLRNTITNKLADLSPILHRNHPSNPSQMASFSTSEMASFLKIADNKQRRC